MEPRQLEAARRFLAVRRIAVVGVSHHEKDFSRMVFRALAERGYDVVGVNPAVSEVDGRPCFARLADVAPRAEAALLLTPPDRTDGAVQACADAGIRHVWLHRGGGPGAATPAAVALGRSLGLDLVTDLCPFMVLPGAGLPHRLHGFFRRHALARAERRA